MKTYLIILAVTILLLIIFFIFPTYDSECFSEENENYPMTSWGPRSNTRTLHGKSFYTESKKIILNKRILRKIEGSDVDVQPLEWIILSDPRYKYYSAPHNGQIPNAKPIAIALPDTVDQILKVCKSARIMNVPVSVRGGNHSYIGANSCNGIIISMEKMKKIEINPEEQTVCVETGVRLGELYYALFGASFNFPGGVCPTVGIAGFILGGGEGLLQRKFGLGCNSLIDAEMIVTFGDDFRVIKSVQTEDPQLMQALRGGGQSNFGIITKLKLKVYPMSKYYATFTLKFPLTTSKSGSKWQTEPWKEFQKLSKTLTPDISCYYAFYMPRQPATISYSMVQGQYAGDIPFDLSFLGSLGKLLDVSVDINLYTPENYLQLPLFWAGIDTVEDMLKQCQSYGKEAPQENFRNLTDKYGKNGKLMSDSDIDFFMDALQEYFEKLDPNYIGWVGIKWDMSPPMLKSRPPNVILEGHFSIAQYMYSFVTGQGGGGGSIPNPPPDPIPSKENPSTSIIAQYQQDLYKKLTPVVSGELYINYPVNIVRDPLQYCYGKYFNFLTSLKRKYDPSGFWYQPRDYKLPLYPPKLWRDDGLCGTGLPTLETGQSICNPLANNSVCDQNINSPNFRKCIEQSPVASRLENGDIDYSKRNVM